MAQASAKNITLYMVSKKNMQPIILPSKKQQSTTQLERDTHQNREDPAVTWSVRLIDESAKVSISKVNEKDLVSLFAVMQAEDDSLIDEDDGQPFYDSMMDWVDGDDEDSSESREAGH